MTATLLRDARDLCGYACVSRGVEYVRGLILSRRPTLTRQCRFRCRRGRTRMGRGRDAPGGLDGGDGRDGGGGDARHDCCFEGWGCARGGARANAARECRNGFEPATWVNQPSVRQSRRSSFDDFGNCLTGRKAREKATSRTRGTRGFARVVFPHPPRWHSPPRVRASRRVLRDGEEGEKREEGQEVQEVRAPHRPRPPPAPPRPLASSLPLSRSFSQTAAPDDDPPGFAIPSQDAQEETVAQRGFLLFLLIIFLFRHRGQRGCAPPPRRQDGTREGHARSEERNRSALDSFSPTTTARRRRRRRPFVRVPFLDCT